MTTVPLTPPEDSGLLAHDLLDFLEGSAQPQPTIGGLLYPGSVNSIHAEPGVGKTWIAHVETRDVLRSGGTVGFIDYEDNPTTATTRLLALGVEPTDLVGLFYLQPLGPVGESGHSWLSEFVSGHEVQLVVIDSVAEAMAAESLGGDRAADVTRWVQSFLRPLARAGAAVLVLDHVAKATESRGRWSRGSGAKLAAIDGVAYSLTIEEPFSRDRSGHGILVVAKDRHGAVGGAGQPVRSVRFDVAGGSLHDVRFENYVELGVEPSGHDRIEPSMVRAALEAAPGRRWLSRRDAAEALGVSTDVVGSIMANAVAAGAVAVEHPTERTYIYSVPPDEVTAEVPRERAGPDHPPSPRRRL